MATYSHDNRGGMDNDEFRQISTAPEQSTGKDFAQTTTTPIELGEYNAGFDADSSSLPPLTNTTKKKLLFKIDCRLVPCLTVLCLICLLDRTNLGNAVVYGLEEELQLSGVQYSTALTMFFVTYIVFDIPSNILLKKLTPCYFLSGATFLFGLVTLCTGFVRNYAGLLSMRLLLGLAQAGILPGCSYLTGSWYTRGEGLKRFSLYLSAVSLSSVFGGLIAAGMGKMNKAGGLSGWRWLFVVEGIVTCLIGIVFFFVMPNFPEDTKWLTDEEREYVKARLEAEQGNSGIDLAVRPRDVWDALRDPKIVLLGLIHLSVSMPGNMVSYFAPIIVDSFGIYSPIQTQLQTAPVWVVAFALSLGVAFVSDKMQHRYLATVLCAIVAITGFSVLFAEYGNIRAQYGALFLAAGGISSLWPVEVCWGAMNLGGHRRRAVGSAVQFAVGNIGGVVSSYAFQIEDAREYQLAYAISISFCCIAALLCTLYAWSCWRENRKRAARGWGVDLSDDEKAKLGDLSPSYKFMI